MCTRLKPIVDVGFIVQNSGGPVTQTFWMSKNFSDLVRSSLRDDLINPVKMSVCPYVRTRDVHGNGKDRDPMGSIGFPWEWEYDQPWDGNGMGVGLRCVGNGNKTWEWEKSVHAVRWPTSDSLLSN